MNLCSKKEYLTIPWFLRRDPKEARKEMSDIEIAVEVRAKTEKALLIFDGKTECWIPRSQINDYCEEKDTITSIFISEWLAEQKGLI